MLAKEVELFTQKVVMRAETHFSERIKKLCKMSVRERDRERLENEQTGGGSHAKNPLLSVQVKKLSNTG